MSNINLRLFGALFPRGEENLSSQVIRYANELWSSETVYRRNSNPYGILIFIRQGIFRFQSGSLDREVHPGGLCCFSHDVPHILSVKSSEVILSIITFKGERFDHFLQKHFQSKFFIHQVIRNDAITSLYREIERTALEVGPHSMSIANHLLMSVLYLIREDLLTGTSTEKDLGSNLFNRCKQYIDQHYLIINSSKEVAQANNLSQVHLCRLFKKSMGKSPHQYLLLRKVEHIAHEITVNPRQIKDIALRYGFSDAYCLSKTFKKVMGTSPRHYLASLMKES